MKSDDIRRIVVTGAGGQITYALLFRLAAGALFGPEQKIALVLHDLPEAQDRLIGVAMELADGAFPLLEAVITTADISSAFEDADVAFLVGAKPRGKGMERSDLLKDNAGVFEAQGKALNEVAKPTIKVVVIGNPANTNALILARNAPRIPRRNITSMMRLDHNRALSMIAKMADADIEDVSNLAVWGNHSPTMYPDVSNARVARKTVSEVTDVDWLRNAFIPAVAQRGAAVIAARGSSSAASAANAALDHMRDWIHGTDGKWVSMGVFTEGAFGFDEDLVIGVPVTCANGDFQIVDLEIDAASRLKIDLSIAELAGERNAIYGPSAI
jgi:malate dehydrogenase